MGYSCSIAGTRRSDGTIQLQDRGRPRRGRLEDSAGPPPVGRVAVIGLGRWSGVWTPRSECDQANLRRAGMRQHTPEADLDLPRRPADVRDPPTNDPYTPVPSQAVGAVVLRWSCAATSVGGR